MQIPRTLLVFTVQKQAFCLGTFVSQTLREDIDSVTALSTAGSSEDKRRDSARSCTEQQDKQEADQRPSHAKVRHLPLRVVITDSHVPRYVTITYRSVGAIYYVTILNDEPTILHHPNSTPYCRPPCNKVPSPSHTSALGVIRCVTILNDKPAIPHHSSALM